MTESFVFGGRQTAISVVIVTAASYPRFLKKLGSAQVAWLEQNQFEARAGKLLAIPDADGNVERFICGVSDLADPFAIADLPMQLPEGLYTLEGSGVKANIEALAIGWGLGAYQFTRYKNARRKPARLKLPNSANHPHVQETVAATNRVRDLINTPAEDMMPQHISAVVGEIAQTHAAEFQEIIGDDLLTSNYPCIHTVGRASVHPPRLIELLWGDKSHPLLTLVGKGISFDSGGLNIKPSNGMRSMKKDMGGAAHAIGLAQLIMALELPVRLRLLVAAAENAISSNSFRPGDVIQTRSGITVEIDNTDAEGRLVLCDALTEACEEKPDLLIDFATLTGAARVAVGTEIAAFFSNDKELAADILDAGEQVSDPTWQLPLHRGYRSLLKSHVADLQNCASSPFGGAITAALYLQGFVDNEVSWAHFDVMAWNNRSRSGRPIGGEAMGLRAVFEMLEKRYK
ncbi:leucyl aminopeptidase [Chromatiales bacterium (ex Bugula neritina AB1)]|nr:leucyl aminopeptidase [Chromatiales bacterium (ex Bugula neritina AB1)]